MAISYCTLSQAQTEAKINNTDGDFQTYYEAVYGQATQRIDRLTNGMEFAPRIMTRYFNGYVPDLQYDVLYLDFPLLSVTSIVINGTNTLTASDYDLEVFDGDAANTIWRDDGWTFTDDRRRAIAVTGTWGFRRYYNDGEGWRAVTTMNDAGGISATDTTVTVTDASQIAEGQMLRIESEFLSVTSKAANTLTIRRGIRGSTAAIHADTTSVEVWEPEPDISQAAAMLVSYGYKRRGDYGEAEFQTDLGATLRFPPDTPRTVQNIVNKYRRGYARVF